MQLAQAGFSEDDEEFEEQKGGGVKSEFPKKEMELRGTLAVYMKKEKYDRMASGEKRKLLMSRAALSDLSEREQGRIVDDLMEKHVPRDWDFQRQEFPKVQTKNKHWHKYSLDDWEVFLNDRWNDKSYKDFRGGTRQSLWGTTEAHWIAMKDNPDAIYRIRRYIRVLRAYHDGEAFPVRTGDAAKDLDPTPPSWAQHNTFSDDKTLKKISKENQLKHDDPVGRAGPETGNKKAKIADHPQTHDPPDYTIEAKLQVGPYLGTWNKASFISMMFIKDGNQPRTADDIVAWLKANEMADAWTMTQTQMNQLPLRQVQLKPPSSQYVLDRKKILPACFRAPTTIADMKEMILKGFVPVKNKTKKTQRRWKKITWSKAPYAGTEMTVWKEDTVQKRFTFGENYREVVQALFTYADSKKPQQDYSKIKKQERRALKEESRQGGTHKFKLGDEVQWEEADGTHHDKIVWIEGNRATLSRERDKPNYDLTEVDSLGLRTFRLYHPPVAAGAGGEPLDQPDGPPDLEEPELAVAQIGEYYRNSQTGLQGRFMGIDNYGMYLLQTLTAGGFSYVQWNPSWEAMAPGTEPVLPPANVITPMTFGDYGGFQVAAFDDDTYTYVSGGKWHKGSRDSFEKKNPVLQKIQRFSKPELLKAGSYLGLFNSANRAQQYRGTIVGYNARSNTVDVDIPDIGVLESPWHPDMYTAAPVNVPAVNVEPDVEQTEYVIFADEKHLMDEIQKDSPTARLIHKVIMFERAKHIDGEGFFTRQDWLATPIPNDFEPIVPGNEKREWKSQLRREWVQIIKRRKNKKNYFRESEDGGFRFNMNSEKTNHELLSWYEAKYKQPKQAARRDASLHTLLQKAEAMEDTTVDIPEDSELDHHHSQLVGFLNPGALHTTREMRQAIGNLVLNNDHDSPMAVYYHLLQKFEVYHDTHYIDPKKHGAFTDAYLSQDIQHDYGLSMQPSQLHPRIEPALAARLAPNVARYIPDRRVRNQPGVHALTQLVRAPIAGENDRAPGDERALVAYHVDEAVPDGDVAYNLAAKTRMDWHKNAHVLETFAMHGGRQVLEQYFGGNPRHDDKLQLKWLDNKAKEVFARMKYLPDRGDLRDRGGNWQMAHIAKMAAKRVRGFMTAGPHVHRTFKHVPGREAEYVESRRASHHTASYNRYHLPLAGGDEFMRMAKLPGMAGYLHEEGPKPDSKVPWIYHGKENYHALMDRNDTFRHEQRHPDAFFHDNFEDQNFAQRGSQSGREAKEFYNVVDAMHHVKKKIKFNFAGEHQPPVVAHEVAPVPEQHFNAAGQDAEAPIEGDFDQIGRQFVPQGNLLAMAQMLPREEMRHYEGDFEGGEYYDAFTESSASDDDDDLRKMFPEFFDIYNF